MESKTVEFFNKLSFTILIATVFGSLFFFIPFVPVSLAASKGFLISIGSTLALFFWLISRLGEGKFKIPSDRLIIYGAAIPVVFFLASFFSSSKYISFFGNGFEIGTFGSMFVLFTIFFLSSIYFQTEKRLWYFFRTLMAGALVVTVFQLLYLFVDLNHYLPNFLKGISGNLVGTWNDFALFLGLIVLVSILTLEFVKTSGLMLALQYLLLVASLFFVMVVNVPLVWLLVGIFAVVIFVYSISLQQAGMHVVVGASGKKRFPFVALVVVLLSFVFLVANNTVGGLISKYVNLSNSQVRPSITTTAQIAGKALKQNPLFGTGPNTFAIDWALWKPSSIAQTSFWNVDFDSGVGVLPTFVVTTGLLGIASLLLFLAVLFIRGLQSFKVAMKDTLSNYFIFSTLLTLIYTWVVIACYTPNVVMLLLAFASSGILIAILVHKEFIHVQEFSFLKDPRKSFFSILGLMVLMIGTVSVTYLYAEKFASIVFFSKSLNSNNSTQALVKSENMLLNAISLDANDLYYRSLSQVYVAQIGALVSDKSISADILKSSVQQLVNSAQASALKAVEQNPKQYLNQMNLANIYASLVPLGVANSYESSVAAYGQAALLAPTNPSIPLARAQLEFAKKNNDQAKSYINQALSIKADYTDALLFLAQINVSEGDLPGAIKQTENAASKSPNDPTIFFVMGSYRYNNGDYAGAISALETAVLLNPNYLNARYTLGQAYQKAGRTGDALIQYKILNKIVPNNQDVKSAMDSLSKASPSSATVVSPTTKTTAPAKKPATTTTTTPKAKQ
ncbi:MAG: tetratricopeptide repeat protein [bacterium]